MKKGQRPSRHYRNVKTKKGRKRILINKNVKRKAKRSRGFKKRIEFDDIKQASPDELKRRIQQQIQMNISKDIEEIRMLEKEFAPEIELKRKQKQREVSESIEQSRQDKIQLQKDRETRQNKRFTYKKLKELERLGLQLERKKKAENKLNFYDDLNVDQKLDRADELAKSSGDQQLINTAKQMRKFFSDEILEPQFETGKMSELETNLYEVGKEMLAMPEVKTSIDLTQPSLTFKEQEELAKKMTAETEMRENELMKQKVKMDSMLERAKKTKYKERADILRFAKKARREVETDLNISLNKRNEIRDKLRELKKMDKRIKN